MPMRDSVSGQRVGLQRAAAAAGAHAGKACRPAAPTPRGEPRKTTPKARVMLSAETAPTKASTAPARHSATLAQTPRHGLCR
jgi:hypothetical protein